MVEGTRQQHVDGRFSEVEGRMLQFEDGFEKFRVVARIGTVAYRLLLPIGLQIHSVSHVSQLKKVVGTAVTPSTNLPTTGLDGQLVVYSQAVLERKLIKRNNGVVVQWLVQWSNLNPEDVTWMDASVMASQYPKFEP
ncbi:hypothetical protein LWI29_025142 [Acer saccharum]|uniref:Tf2-1-like SH3-like domain-containing protein n=1 Tax=Acer saccharum TaxID=4024 RepID=A0AA39RE56_ACESA|nr:hypothetical protein LWI29_025142 [Acer saccharum]